MESSKIILYISILIVVLLLVDAYRRSVRRKNKAHREKSFSSVNSIMNDNQDIEEKGVSNQLPIESSSPSLHNGLIVLHIMAPRGFIFYGEDLLDAFHDFGFQSSSDGFFQSVNENNLVLFKLMNCVKPGLFDLENIKDLKTSGITVIMDLFDCHITDQDYKNMLNSMNDLSESLGSTLLNESMLRFTEDNYREHMSYISTAISHNHKTNYNL